MLRLLLILAFAHVTKASLIIGAFNVKRLSNNKAQQTEIVHLIAQILARYDISVVEEVMDAPAIQKVLDEMNRIGGPFSMSLGPARGRWSGYQEHIAIMYRHDKVDLRGTDLYPDPADKFEREPYSAAFHTTQSRVTDFAVMGIHLKPSDVPSEMEALVDAYEHAVTKLGTQNILLAGDFNADCTYLSPTQYHQSSLWTDARFYFLISADADTTASHNTDCAYDRFVVAGSELRAAVVADSVQVYNMETQLHLSFSQAWNVSDHYPIQLQLQ